MTSENARIAGLARRINLRLYERAGHLEAQPLQKYGTEGQTDADCEPSYQEANHGVSRPENNECWSPEGQSDANDRSKNGPKVTSDIFVSGVQSGPGWIDVLTCLFTGAGVVLLAFYTLYTRRLAELTSLALAETRRSNEDTQESNERTQRSRLFPANLRLSDDGEWATLLLVNGGRIPCVVGRSAMSAIRTSSYPETLPPFEEEDFQRTRSGLVVPPGSEGIEFTSRIPKIAEEADTESYLVYCYIEYGDDFGKSWTTTYCWKYYFGGTRVRWFHMPQYCKMT